MTRRTRIVLILVGGLIGFSALANLVEHLTPTPHGPPSSSYATAPEGLAAYAELLGDYGHPVRRVRSSPGQARLDPASTAILLDPDPMSDRDVDALRSFLRGGGRLVAGGPYPDRWLDKLLDPAPEWTLRDAGLARPLAPVPEVAGVRTVESAGPGSWREDTGQALPVVAGNGGSIVAVARVGLGRAILVADPSPLQNRLLDHADNAALGLALAGERKRTVRFLESVHGYRPASGLAAIPWSWRFALGGLALAALTLMVARGRRLGPPEAEGRELAPPRRVYVESLAAVLARTKRPGEALEPVRAEVKRLLARRAELTAPDDQEALRAAGRRAGLTDDEVASVLGELKGKAGVLAAGRALAKLEAAPGSAP
jgi:hypothetical protein